MRNLHASLQNTLRRYNSTELRDRMVKSMRPSYRPRSTIRRDGYGLGIMDSRRCHLVRGGLENVHWINMGEG
jgi:hypothetical protein